LRLIFCETVQAKDTIYSCVGRREESANPPSTQHQAEGSWDYLHEGWHYRGLRIAYSILISIPSVEADKQGKSRTAAKVDLKISRIVCIYLELCKHTHVVTKHENKSFKRGL